MRLLTAIMSKCVPNTLDYSMIAHLIAVVGGTVIGPCPDFQATVAESVFASSHVFEFRHGLISRENIWLDSAVVVARTR